MALLRISSSILKATVDTPTALNMLTKSLSANLAASIHPHQQHRSKEQLKDRRVPEPTRSVPTKSTLLCSLVGERGVLSVNIEASKAADEMDASPWLNNSKYFKVFRPGEGKIHVLVVLPKNLAADPELLH
ncbi:Crinkler (CRN) [Phytophthora cinnamomi]|uniref:Crinkler (CRN) n=1 Tax=Phytophthora cinnamomi TaxID=4785 RepID=UPI0035598F62|nr:Crinkler (CRN) [Phytophthora cinnamomi]